MSMNFYIGPEYQLYNKKFEAVQKYIRMHEQTKTGSRAETFRWMVDRMYKHIKELIDEAKR